MVSFCCPANRSGPGFSVEFGGIGAAIKEELYQIGKSPTTGPTEGSAPE